MQCWLLYVSVARWHAWQSVIFLLILWDWELQETIRYCIYDMIPSLRRGVTDFMTCGLQIAEQQQDLQAQHEAHARTVREVEVQRNAAENAQAKACP